MNQIVCPDEIASRAVTVSQNAASFPGSARLPQRIVLGMPHLSAVGLSESWLLKELGHRHWFMLAEAAGMPVPSFHDANGEPVYAAFSAISIADGDLGSARENDVLTFTSDIARLSRTQVASRHLLTIDGRPIGSVELVSTFVRRAAGGGNHTVARVAVAGLPPIDPQATARNIAALAAAFREGSAETHLGFARNATAEIARFTFDPCPSQDFNGAGFLYFTSFLGFIDRAEWAFDRQSALTATTVQRDVFFRRNIDPGESISVVLINARHTEGMFAHRCRVERCTDGALLADVFSIRARGP